MALNLELGKVAGRNGGNCSKGRGGKISENSAGFTSTIQQLLDRKPTIFEVAKQRLAEAKAALAKSKKKRRK